MKLTNEKIITFMNLQLTEKKLPIKLAYALSVNYANCEMFAKQYENSYNQLIQKYAEKDDEGNVIPPNEDNSIRIIDPVAFSEEVRELLSVENEIPITTTSVEALEKCDSEMFDSLSVAEISSISFMIEN